MGFIIKGIYHPKGPFPWFSLWNEKITLRESPASSLKFPEWNLTCKTVPLYDDRLSNRNCETASKTSKIRLTPVDVIKMPHSVYMGSFRSWNFFKKPSADVLKMGDPKWTYHQGDYMSGPTHWSPAEGSCAQTLRPTCALSSLRGLDHHSSSVLSDAPGLTCQTLPRKIFPDPKSPKKLWLCQLWIGHSARSGPPFNTLPVLSGLSSKVMAPPSPGIDSSVPLPAVYLFRISVCGRFFF